jgi:hypothetical protein
VFDGPVAGFGVVSRRDVFLQTKFTYLSGKSARPLPRSSGIPEPG